MTNRKRKKTSGFRSRQQTAGGRRTIKRRRTKGRSKITIK